jgi:hypothetical protein
MPASWLTHDARVRFNLSELAIGYGRFSVGKKFSISIEPAYLAFKIYVPDEDYNVIITKLNMGKIFESLSLNFEDVLGERSDRLKYGWEPDGSRIIWNYSEDEQPPMLQLTSYEMVFLEHLNAGSNSKKNSEEVMLKSDWVRILKEIKYAIYAIGFVFIFSIFAGFIR